MNVTQSSFKGGPLNNLSNKNNMTSTDNLQAGDTVVFFESEYFSSTMPSSLPSDIKRDAGKPTTVFMNQINRPQTPSYKPANYNMLNIDATSLG